MGLNKQMETAMRYIDGLENKEKPFKGTNYFNRLSDTNAYTTLDSINAATPISLEIDLSSYVSAGETIAITNISITVSTKLSGASVNAWISLSDFTATTDNSEFALTDTEAINSFPIPCLNLFTTANNSKILSDAGLWVVKLSGSSLYVGLQAASGFTPGSNERWDVLIEGVILA